MKMNWKLVIFTLAICVVVQFSESIGHKNIIQLPKCEACERLVESFLKGVERTEKNNFAGGNTAWEESQLGSYANSEVRFVEIQESLCEDNRTTMDQCQILAEELEEYLEQWWAKDRWDVPDLRHYLCVNKVQYCYPKLTSSVQTTPPSTQPTFPVDGLKCPAGFELSSSYVCEDVNECWSNPCKNNEFCLNTEGSYLCRLCHSDCLKCFGPGPYECKEYRNFPQYFIATILSLYQLSMIGPSFIFAYIFVILCTNLVLKIPLVPSLFLACLVFCLAVKMFLEEKDNVS